MIRNVSMLICCIVFGASVLFVRGGKIYMLKMSRNPLATHHWSFFSWNNKIVVISFLVIVPDVSCYPQFLLLLSP